MYVCVFGVCVYMVWCGVCVVCVFLYVCVWFVCLVCLVCICLVFRCVCLGVWYIFSAGDSIFIFYRKLLKIQLCLVIKNCMS